MRRKNLSEPCMNVFCYLGFHKWEQLGHERECKKCGRYQTFEIVEGINKHWVTCIRPVKWKWANRVGPHDFSQCEKMKEAFRRASDASPNARPEQTGIATGTPVESDHSRHEWQWESTGAGSGWYCRKCDTFVHHHPDSGPPPTACPQTGSPFYEPNTYSPDPRSDNSDD